jgi:predicted site-specific integrase-resolvase
MGEVVAFPGRGRPKLWRKHEVAEFFGRHERTIERWQREDGLPCVRPSKGTVRYSPEEVRAWAAGDRAPVAANERVG